MIRAYHEQPGFFHAYHQDSLAILHENRYLFHMEEERDEVGSAKVVLLHGFTKEQIFAVMRAVKQELGPAQNVAFAMTTPNSLQMKTADLIEDIQGDHAYLKKNPPVQAAHPEKA